MNKQPNYRQGDVPLVPIASIPESFDRVQLDGPKIVLALGEATGHHHRVEFSFDAADNPRLYRDALTGAQILEIGGGGATLLHEEHDSIVLPAGRYLQLVQVEDDGEMIARVAD
jgi:hypothetical protein